MIIAENPKPSLDEFKALMARIDVVLNNCALSNASYFLTRGGTSLEEDVRDVAMECSKNTKFEGSIHLVSGATFPDIVAAKYYGIEVKSTTSNHWKTIGNSILETTRISDVERIFLTFGKLSNPVSFISRPYEECLSGIAVTHYPRYQIDMSLGKGETIFDKMGVSYDELRSMNNPVTPVAQYYKSKLKQGESLWWAGDRVEAEVPAMVRLWRSLSARNSRAGLRSSCATRAARLWWFISMTAGATAKAMVSPSALPPIPLTRKSVWRLLSPTSGSIPSPILSDVVGHFGVPPFLWKFI